MTEGPAEGDAFTTIDEGPEVEIRDRGSRFFGQAFPATGEEAVKEALQAIRRKYHDATHHCWASTLGPPGEERTVSDDDGEPSNTAGAPILAALTGAGIKNALVVVTRWFGGTKLGGGGLVRAYGAAAREALQAAPRRTVWRDQRIDLRCSYEDLGAVEAVLSRRADALGEVTRRFEAEPLVELAVRRSRVAGLEAELREATGARVRLTHRDA